MQPTTMLQKLTNSTQTITFSEGDGVSSSEVYSTDVVVTTNAGSHNHGSSKVKLKSLVDYNWEPKFYPGQLLAVHISGKYLAYSIKAPNAANPGTWNGMVRVVYNPEPDIDRRTLIKGMKGEVQDLSFAHIQNQVVLACIDELGNFYIHEIEITDSGLRTTLVMEVREDTGVGGSTHRVVWCPYIPDEDDATDDDAAKLLLTTHAHIARMWNVRTLAARGAALTAGAALAGGGARAAAEHAAPLLAAAFSPDGSALATAAADGYVMFFQVYMNNESNPRCLHKWQPHGGKPLSSLFFLDNHKNYNTDVQFWKYAVTGAENNTSIKVWSCKSWNCLQSITFSPSLSADASLGMKAMLDTSANYLLLSDFKARSLYVLHMARDTDDSAAYCRSISEFLLPYPVLSFCIVDAEEIQPKCESGCDDPYHRNGGDGTSADSPDEFDLHHDEGGVECGGGGAAQVRLRLYIVQPKGLQEGELLYEPPDTTPGMEQLALEASAAEDAAPAAMPSSILQQQSQQLKNLLMRSQTQPGSLISQRPESPPPIPPQLNLMTPDAFSSPGKRDEDDPPLSATPDVGIKQRVSISGVEEVSAGAAPAAAGEGKPPSGGSSPSREVQQIMAHEQTSFYKDLRAPLAAAEEPLFAGELFVSPEKPPPPAKLTHTNSDTSWPQISIEQIAEANQRKASSDRSSNQSLNALPAPLATPLAPLNPPLVAPVTPLPALPPLNPLPALAPLNPLPALPPPAPQPERAASEDVSKSRIEALEQKLDKLTELLTQQSRDIRALRSEVQAPRELLDEALDAHGVRTTAAIEAALTDGWERIARVGETASMSAAQAAGKGAARALEPLAAALQHELAAKLSATDHLLRDNIEKLATSKSVAEKLSVAVAKSLSELVRDSFRAALADHVLPVMEKAHAQIFKQINHAFQSGTKEFAANTEAAARAAAERGGAAAAASLRAALERHAEALAHAAPPPPQQYTAALKEVAHSVLEKELSWWREQARAVQLSRAHSPATPAATSVADRQKSQRNSVRTCVHESLPFLLKIQVSQIQSLIMSGDVNGAFQLALSASDLALVVAACRAAEPARVFGPPCRLKQHVLLSLVQQLAADMARDTHLKHRYLEEAIMNLDTTNPVTREHLPVVIRELQKQIVSFLGANPGHALTRQFRMLLMATEALVKSSV
ncbi:enhancer of mRNA-decapping protein 4 isoform X2 [Epargyreus clarus]|uniref:enhancer of mRNA-decapping protein 4 isoform X2 n=1 Tax=Epargyreus clarus TaxID=520877 RepID=UPI003C300ED0